MRDSGRVIRRLRRTPATAVLSKLHPFADVDDGTAFTRPAFAKGLCFVLGIDFDADGVGPSIAELFDVFDGGGGAPVEVRQLASGLSVFGSGASTELCHAVFDLYCARGSKAMTKGDFALYAEATLRMIAAHHPDAPTGGLQNAGRMAEAVASRLFDKLDTSHDGTLDFDEFSGWFMENLGRGDGGHASTEEANIIRRVDVEQALGLSAVSLSRVMQAARASCADDTDTISHDAFVKCILEVAGVSAFDAGGAVVDSAMVDLAERIFLLLDANGDNWLTLRELGIGISLVCSNSSDAAVEAACRVLFELCTVEGTPPRIPRGELTQCAERMVRVAAKLDGPAQALDVTGLTSITAEGVLFAKTHAAFEQFYAVLRGVFAVIADPKGSLGAKVVEAMRIANAPVRKSPAPPPRPPPRPPASPRPTTGLPPLPPSTPPSMPRPTLRTPDAASNADEQTQRRREALDAQMLRAAEIEVAAAAEAEQVAVAAELTCAAEERRRATAGEQRQREVDAAAAEQDRHAAAAAKARRDADAAAAVEVARAEEERARAEAVAAAAMKQAAGVDAEARRLRAQAADAAAETRRLAKKEQLAAQAEQRRRNADALAAEAQRQAAAASAAEKARKERLADEADIKRNAAEKEAAAMDAKRVAVAKAIEHRQRERAAEAAASRARAVAAAAETARVAEELRVAAVAAHAAKAERIAAAEEARAANERAAVCASAERRRFDAAARAELEQRAEAERVARQQAELTSTKRAEAASVSARASELRAARRASALAATDTARWGAAKRAEAFRLSAASAKIATGDRLAVKKSAHAATSPSTASAGIVANAVQAAATFASPSKRGERIEVQPAPAAAEKQDEASDLNVDTALRVVAQEVCAAAEATLARFVASSPAGAHSADEFRAFFRSQLSPKVRETLPSLPRSMESVYSPAEGYGSIATEATLSRAVHSTLLPSPPHSMESVYSRAEGYGSSATDAAVSRAVLTSRSPLSALRPSSPSAANRSQRSSRPPLAAVYDAYRPPYAESPTVHISRHGSVDVRSPVGRLASPVRLPIDEAPSPFAAPFEQLELQRIMAAKPQASPPSATRSTAVMESELVSLLARSAVGSQAIDAASIVLPPQHSRDSPTAKYIRVRPFSPSARSPVARSPVRHTPYSTSPSSFSARAAPDVLQ
jgi:hypothetical protein